MRKFILPLFLVFILLASGCTSLDPTSLAKATPAVSKFLEDYPNAEVKATHYTAEETAAVMDQLRADCDKESVTAKEYYKVTVNDSESGLSVTAWVDVGGQLVECVVKRGNMGEKVVDDDDDSGNGCVAKNSVECRDGHLYWFDSCGKKGEKYKYCENGCENGACKGETGCQKKYALKCHEGHVYWFDSCGSVDGKKEYCNYGCVNGACVKGNDSDCYDSDGGYNIFKMGTAKAAGQELSDHCNDDGTLTEKFCQDGVVTWNSTACPSGYVCSDGACTAG